MAQQGKQIRVGACEVFAYHSVKRVLQLTMKRVLQLTSYLTVTGMRLIPIRSSAVVKPSIHFKYCPVSTLTFFDTHSCL